MEVLTFLELLEQVTGRHVRRRFHGRDVHRPHLHLYRAVVDAQRDVLVGESEHDHVVTDYVVRDCVVRGYVVRRRTDLSDSTHCKNMLSQCVRKCLDAHHHSFFLHLQRWLCAWT